MGLLDDAIRDHLDLKRRRGADPSEVERAEREALGPVRRNPTPSELAEADPAATAAVAAYEESGEEDWSHDSLPESSAGAELPPVFDEPAAEPVPAPSRFPAPAVPPFDDVDHPAAGESYDEGPYEEEPHAEQPAHEPFTEAPPARPAMSAGPETAEYNVEDALAAEDHRDRAGEDHRDGEGGEDGEDVLEETPEFLQDTPDHDRLWFEQRPPKDFDFDE
ncbi:MAG TPA: hypothetical protein VHV28_10855 [Solirubrobacteraceae bacterium]|nr:hypothetical protein [Solirubrobacteraceae bacterium]